jgi:hypothetical protein
VTCKVREIKSALTRKGFTEEDDKRHVMYWFRVNGRKTSIRTMISHGETEIRSPLISKMAGQLRVSKDEFLSIVSCAITEDSYRDKMIAEGQIDSP